MARNGAGVYSRISGTPYVYGTAIDQAIVNAEMDDVAAALTESLSKDGQTAATANLPMGGYKHTNVNTATARTDYARASQVQDSALTWCSTAGGTADAFTLSPAISIGAYAAGQSFSFLAVGTNTGAVTANVSGLGAKAVQVSGEALTGGEIVSGKLYSIRYDGTQFQLEQVSVSRFISLLLNDADAAAVRATIELTEALKSNATATLTKGFSATPYPAGTFTAGQTFTPDEANGNLQHCVNGGAFTLAPPTNNCTIVVQITNNASAGTITTSGFTKVTGSALTTTNGDDFFAYITKCNGFSHLAVQALQ